MLRRYRAPKYMRRPCFTSAASPWVLERLRFHALSAATQHMSSPVVNQGIALNRARETCFRRMQASLLHFGALEWSGTTSTQASALRIERCICARKSDVTHLGTALMRQIRPGKNCFFRLIAQKELIAQSQQASFRAEIEAYEGRHDTHISRRERNCGADARYETCRQATSARRATTPRRRASTPTRPSNYMP